MLQEIERILALANGSQLISLIESLKPSGNHGFLVEVALAALARQSPAVAAKTGLELWPEEIDDFPRLMAILLREMGPSLSENEALGQMAGQAWLTWLAEDKTKEAMRWLESNGECLKITERSIGHHRNWSEAKANRALSQLAGLADGETKRQAARAILNQLYQTDPNSALVHARDLLPQGHLQHALTS